MTGPAVLRRRFSRALLACATLALLAGCGASRETAPASSGSTPAQISGTVSRSGTPLGGFKVKLYDDTTGLQVDSTVTDASGAYGFSGVAAGKWMVKVSPTDLGDFGYVRYFLDLSAAGQTAVVPPFDVFAHGLDLLSPADGTDTNPPTFSSPLHFSWSTYQAAFSWMNARLSDAADNPAWASAQGQATSADWNGIGNDGTYAGTVLPAGTYSWRVKIHLGSGVQAATRVRDLILR